MKKTVRRLIASAMLIAALGAGTAAFAERIELPVSLLPHTFNNRHEIQYSFTRGVVNRHYLLLDENGWLNPTAPKPIGEVLPNGNVLTDSGFFDEGYYQFLLETYMHDQNAEGVVVFSEEIA